METRSTLPMRREQQQERSLFLFVVVVGYLVTFTVASNGGTRYSIPQLVMGIIFGGLYLILGFFETEVLQHFPANKRNTLYFAIQITLVFGIGWMLGPGGNWLIGLPLASIAVERLAARSRWFVYVGLLAAVMLPIAHYSTWDTAFTNGFIVSTAIFFVALLTQFRLNERQARQRAEELTVQLEAANQKLAEYASQVEELAAAQERNRLAREIHDTLGHYLTVVSVQLETAKIILDSDPQRVMDTLNKAHELVKKGLASVRESVSALRVSPLENRTLQEAIAGLINETQTSGIRVEFTALGEPHDLDEKAALALYRTVQEALTNVRKHANASCVDIHLDFSESGEVRLSVRDNGMGAANPSGGFGLIGIRERIQLLGGECRIETEIGKGFCLEVSVPVGEEVGE